MEKNELLQCPDCGSPGEIDNASWRCSGCMRIYPQYEDIIDFRLQLPSMDLSFSHTGAVADERNRIQEALVLARQKDFSKLVDHYFEHYPTVSSILEGERLTLLNSKENADWWLFQVAQSVDFDALRNRKNKVFVEVGCGAGGILVSLASSFDFVIGVDADMHRLVLAQKQLRDAGVSNVQLVCAFAEKLPIVDQAADLICSFEVLEHVPDRVTMLQQIQRILKEQSKVFLTTPNRFSLMPEPHVHLFGVGFLPRKWADPYVRWRIGVPYTNKHNPSYWELNGLFADVFGRGGYRFVRNKRTDYTFQGRLATVAMAIPGVASLVNLVLSGYNVVAWNSD